MNLKTLNYAKHKLISKIIKHQRHDNILIQLKSFELYNKRVL